ncbi:NACHT domain-containing protein [Kordia sp. TARA_039_SRF]|nr:NACHT domain-containing protein [Kordia sp. TARA_039_SRF]
MNEFGESILENLILPIVKDIALPKIQSIFKKFQIKSISQESVEIQLRDYLERRYTKFITIDTLAFPNMQTKLETLYQPLTISSWVGTIEENLKVEIDHYPEDLLPMYKKVMIEDTAGMGKSTITKKLFQSIIKQKAGIPVLIELSQIKKRNSILKEIQNQMSQIGKKINQNIILKLINEGNFIFLFDGYDEIALVDREFTIRELHRFIEKAGSNYFLITSRPEDSLASLGDFQKFHIEPLEKEEAYKLLTKYDTYGHNKIADSLIEKLEESDETLKEYLSNPFLVSLLYKSYEYKKDIPVKKSQFYQKVYDALFEAHDLAKEGYLKREKYSQLHIDDFERVLRYLGFFTSKANKVEYDKNSIISFIEKCKRQTEDLKFKTSDYLKDLLNTVPLFKKEGNNYKWAHKSLQDYFAAKFIWMDAKESRVDILKKIYLDEENQRFYNVLILYYELDPKGFEHTILKWLLIDFKEFRVKSYNAFQLEDKYIVDRIENVFTKKSTVIILAKEIDYERNASVVYNEYLVKAKIKGLLSLDQSAKLEILKNPNRYVFIASTHYQNLALIKKLISAIYPDLIKKYSRFDTYIDMPFKIDEGNIYMLDDSESNILNLKDNFKFVNQIMGNSHMNNNLDYNACMYKLRELKKNNPEKEKNELLDW